MFEDTRPADLDALGGEDGHASFRVGHPQERLALLRQLRDAQTPVILNGPDGSAVSTALWSVDTAGQRLAFTAPPGTPALDRLVEADEAVAVSYMDSIKLQFDLHHLVLVRGAQGVALQSAMPTTLYRFQRRSSYRVRPPARQAPELRFRHPAIPEMQLALRVLDLSIGGCALWAPHDVPALQPGTRVAEAVVELDPTARFVTGLQIHHVTGQGGGGGVRLGCSWLSLPGAAERLLQRWIDQAQKRSRLLTLD